MLYRQREKPYYFTFRYLLLDFVFDAQFFFEGRTFDLLFLPDSLLCIWSCILGSVLP